MKEDKKKRWEEIITTTNRTHNSCKAWKTVKNKSNDPASSTPPCLVSTKSRKCKPSFSPIAHQQQRQMYTKPMRPELPPTIEVGEQLFTHSVKRSTEEVSLL